MIVLDPHVPLDLIENGLTKLYGPEGTDDERRTVALVVIAAALGYMALVRSEDVDLTGGAAPLT